MKQVKFRSWSNTYQKMLYVTSLDLENDMLRGKDADGKPFTQPKPLKKGVLMQFTGLKDRHGKEIYEHDFVTYDGGEPQLVIWDADNTEFNCGSNTDKPLVKTCCELLEVVGNLHETPNLLTPKR